MRLGRMKSGEIAVDRLRSHIHGDVIAVLPEVLGEISLTEDFGEFEVDLGRIVGTTSCVDVGPKDDVRLEVRPGRRWPSRVVYGRQPEPCSWVTVVLKRDYDRPSRVVLITAYVGRYVGPEDSDPRSTPESRARWATRALIA